MINDAISIQPQDPAKLRDVGQLLRRGSAKLVGEKGEQAALPEPLHELLMDIVRKLENGRSLILMPEEQQLTTQRAAEPLGMSRSLPHPPIECGRDAVRSRRQASPRRPASMTTQPSPQAAATNSGRL